MEKSHTMATHERTVRARYFLARFMATVLRILSKVHISVYRWTGGIIGGRIFGNRMLLLTTTGRKTGQPRTKPVGYLTDGDAMIIVGGAAGAAKHPDWWLNLQSHPEAQVQVGRRRLRVSATRALPEEQQRLWARYPAQHALFESMQKRVSREIPVVILRPLSESSLAHEKPVKNLIQTINLRLLPFERIHVETLLRNKSELAALLQVTVPDGWPHFPEAFSLSAIEAHESNLLEADWHGYFFLHPKDRVLVGNGAFKGPPDDSGTIEIGYEIASEYWNRGLATEAVQGMIDYAFSHEEVRAVIAHTLAQRNASNRVLQKVGMKFIAEVDDPEEGKIWRWQISRDEYHTA